MTICILCGKPTTHGGATHWSCGVILPDDPRHAAISVADHLMRALSPKRVQRADGKYATQPPPTLHPAQLRAKLRPELYEHFDDGLDLALALAAGAIRREPSGALRLAPTLRRSAKPKDDGSEARLFDLPQEGR